ncbi:MAG: hypothetical protein WAU89_23305 [Candidatus Acidiferrales bacterium]
MPATALGTIAIAELNELIVVQVSLLVHVPLLGSEKLTDPDDTLAASPATIRKSPVLAVTLAALLAVP